MVRPKGQWQRASYDGHTRRNELDRYPTHSQDRSECAGPTHAEARPTHAGTARRGSSTLIRTDVITAAARAHWLHHALHAPRSGSRASVDRHDRVGETACDGASEPCSA